MIAVPAAGLCPPTATLSAHTTTHINCTVRVTGRARGCQNVLLRLLIPTLPVAVPCNGVSPHKSATSHSASSSRPSYIMDPAAGVSLHAPLHPQGQPQPQMLNICQLACAEPLGAAPCLTFPPPTWVLDPLKTSQVLHGLMIQHRPAHSCRGLSMGAVCSLVLKPREHTLGCLSPRGGAAAADGGVTASGRAGP